MPYRAARVRFDRPVRVQDDVTLQGEIPLRVELEGMWLNVEVEANGSTSRHAVPATSIELITWDPPKPYPPMVSRGGL